MRVWEDNIANDYLVQDNLAQDNLSQDNFACVFGRIILPMIILFKIILLGIINWSAGACVFGRLQWRVCPLLGQSGKGGEATNIFLSIFKIDEKTLICICSAVNRQKGASDVL